ncbi:putative defense protein 3 [Daphnia carinata]|uniref:putative defense protein 3 n=1 Tax=Daphnia carinata TaxID=120202 RepID=UPI00257D2370|nr:putative defense protein 3 [Daphnia carinata]
MSASNMFKYVCLSLALYLALNANSIQGAPNGAPRLACGDMVPQHGVDPQTSASPFVTTPASTSIAQGSSVTLTLAPISAPDTFKGYLVIGFDNANQAAGPIGTFSAISDGQTLDCPGVNAMNAATHVNNATKTSVTLDWTAPAGFVGTVLFKTSYVQNVATFWVATPASLVTVA